MFRIANIQEDVCKLSQGTRDVLDYYTELESFWDELESFCPLPFFTCAT